MQTRYGMVLSAAVMAMGACSDKQTLVELTQTTVDDTGGVATSADGLVVLEIPAGALSAATEVTIEIDRMSQREGLRSALYRFGPDGQAFAVPVGITFAIESPTAGERLVLANADGPRPIPVDKATLDRATGRLMGVLTHFSSYGAFDATCADNSDCAEQHLCVWGRCEPLCGADSECGLGQVCDVVCVDGPGGSCADGDPCRAGELCFNGACRVVCSSSTHCLSNQSCTPDGLCGSAVAFQCASSLECAAGFACDGTQCRALCNNSAQCGGEVCSGGMCPPQGECSQHGDCGGGEVCIAAECVPVCLSQSDCAMGEICNGVCEVLTAGECGQTDDCAPGEICAAGACRALCVVQSNCPDGMTCQNDICTASALCTSNDHCPGGFICTGGDCAQLCATDRDCNAGHICVNSLCIEGFRPSPTITGVDGDGSTNPGSGAAHFVRSQVIISGTNLGGTTVQLSSVAGAEVLTVVTATATQLVAELPMTLVPGSYTLSVANASGSDSADILFLQGDPGADCPN